MNPCFVTVGADDVALEIWANLPIRAGRGSTCAHASASGSFHAGPSTALESNVLLDMLKRCFKERRLLLWDISYSKSMGPTSSAKRRATFLSITPGALASRHSPCCFLDRRKPEPHARQFTRHVRCAVLRKSPTAGTERTSRSRHFASLPGRHHLRVRSELMRDAGRPLSRGASSVAPKQISETPHVRARLQRPMASSLQASKTMLPAAS